MNIYKNLHYWQEKKMRLWHEEIIHLLPKNQILGQHRECCALRGNGWNGKSSRWLIPLKHYNQRMTYPLHRRTSRLWYFRGNEKIMKSIWAQRYTITLVLPAILTEECVKHVVHLILYLPMITDGATETRLLSDRIVGYCEWSLDVVDRESLTSWKTP